MCVCRLLFQSIYRNIYQLFFVPAVFGDFLSFTYIFFVVRCLFCLWCFTKFCAQCSWVHWQKCPCQTKCHSTSWTYIHWTNERTTTKKTVRQSIYRAIHLVGQRIEFESTALDMPNRYGWHSVRVYNSISTLNIEWFGNFVHLNHERIEQKHFDQQKMMVFFPAPHLKSIDFMEFSF